ncbi:hypothetical protein DLB95_27270 [Salmonella enterica subsp. diarizonae]|uniref:Uncharacterized protein n=2 Tax=Salmonella enterica TaxID=28901 RepID=A0A403T496_SALER|nr:hypothetical protein LFZ53_03705 [Salmonella enterica subsp. diarizonae serovar 50:k:z str. MZ0080]AXC67153.1 hypothetical protein DOE63_17540 [Salmonella enterica subsp. diarizonae serovar 59:z10:-]EAA0682046.1 hypothetical protein [Salmonella enterica subsp. diarizonae]EAA8951662.1 hypothetical protein [Salmonella enterica]ECS6772936.1 hypothetical protein [Salmonella enterica subsp. diarizonae serovar 65:z10:e,n,x,z15]ECU8749873.1 hypothetical protein [Salmonella enterica subsp. diarizon
MDLTPHIAKPPLTKQRFFVITLTKPKRFFMGAFVGALFERNTNKTNNKQHVNRGYDSESGHHLSFFILPYEFLDVFKSISLNIDSFQKLLPYDLHQANINGCVIIIKAVIVSFNIKHTAKFQLSFHQGP